MTAPISRAGALRSEIQAPSATSRSGFRRELERAATRIASDQAALDNLVQHNAPVSNGELLLLQVRVYRYSQEIELGTKLVDRFTQTVRQTLTSQSQ